MSLVAENNTPDWSKFVNWSCVLPPNRPGPEFLRIVQKELERLPTNARIAVLGSTPEFRDSILSAGRFDSLVFDKSAAFYQLMSEHMLYPKETPENLVYGDWLQTLKDFENYFDLVLSDLTWGNIPFNQQEQFGSIVAESLRSGGRLIDRVLVHRRFLKLADLNDSFACQPLNLITLNNFISQWLFCSELISEYGLVDVSAFLDRVLASRFHPSIHTLARKVEVVTPRGNVWFYSPDLNNFDNFYYPNLKTIDCFGEPLQSAFAGFVFTYILERSGNTGSELAGHLKDIEGL